MSLSVSSFFPEKGTKEYFFIVTPDEGSSFLDQLSSIFHLYKTGLAELDLGLETGIYMNIYVSDARSQDAVVRGSSYFKELDENNIATSILQQPPLFSKVAILAYHIVAGGNFFKERLPLKNVSTCISFTNKSHTLYFLKGLYDADSYSVKDQTGMAFGVFSSFCKDRGIPYRNILRTWIYLRDINRDYEDMVEARSQIFSEWGFKGHDRFPASTGIGGRTKEPRSLLSMDAIMIDGVQDEQLLKMEALTHMSPAMHYGVTFERGLKVRYGDRDHLYISGTASINDSGNVIHHNNVIKQTERTLENIRILLEESSGSMDDVVYLTVYLKDSADKEAVQTCLKENLPRHIPCLLLQADVCRPEWLIEIEGMAISKGHHPQYNDF